MLKYITRVFWGERLEWNVSLKPEEVMSLVGSRNEGSWIERIFAPGIGASTGRRRFTLSKMSIGNIPMSANSFAHVLSGKVYETPTGSRVVAQFRLAIPVFIFAIIWLGMAFLIGVGGGVASLIKAASARDIEHLSGAAAMFAAPIVGTGFLNFMRMVGCAENERELKVALTEALSRHSI